MSMTVIEHIEVGSGGAASIEFTSIPQDYTDLYLVISPVDATNTNLSLAINGLNANHTFRNLINELGTVRSYTQSSYGQNAFPIAPLYNSSDASSPTSSAIYLPNYTSSSNKSIFAEYASEGNTASVIGGILAGLWSNSAAITSLKLYIPSLNIEQYSSATLYGITSGSNGSTTVS